MTRRIGMLIFPRLTQLDMTGPYEVLARLPETKVELIAGTLDLFYHTLEALALHDAVARLEIVVGADAYPVHVLLFAGMVVIILGILTIRGSDDTSEVRPHQPESRSAVQSINRSV